MPAKRLPTRDVGRAARHGRDRQPQGTAIDAYRKVTREMQPDLDQLTRIWENAATLAGLPFAVVAS